MKRYLKFALAHRVPVLLVCGAATLLAGYIITRGERGGKAKLDDDLADLSQLVEALRSDRRSPIYLYPEEAFPILINTLRENNMPQTSHQRVPPDRFDDQVLIRIFDRLFSSERVRVIVDRRDAQTNEQLEESLLDDHDVALDLSYGRFRLIEVLNVLRQEALQGDLRIHLSLVEQSTSVITDLQFLPDRPIMLIVKKEGIVKWRNLEDGRTGVLLRIPDVYSESECGLLALAVHPEYENNRSFFVHYIHQRAGGARTARITRWRFPPDLDTFDGEAQEIETLLELPQPYSEHNGGQMAFGVDGYLYVSLGEGRLGTAIGKAAASGERDDVHDLADFHRIVARELRGTLRGKILRIDVNRKDADRAYAIPSDNPVIEGVPRETWALGFRNPWRFAFGPDGSLLVADVGGHNREEISRVEKGGHYGWPLREGSYENVTWEEEPALENEVGPIHDYGRAQGKAVIGGYVYEGSEIEALKGRYLFGDMFSGRIWALRIPQAGQRAADEDVTELGRWPYPLTTFGKDPAGELYVGDLTGRIFRIEPPR